ncbi:MAG: hypothetical protein A2146_01435 [Actinobacteria bacterium RBG_16_67_10]|nr:MAG: hypothetical protein A2146_01435 [Actinobacteria bacterium RBG_16_67_10]
MDLEAVPALTTVERHVLGRALARTAVRLDERPAAYSSAWRCAAAREAVETLPARGSYALSPRSTRGATRA